jgi:hypothetical protein
VRDERKTDLLVLNFFRSTDGALHCRVSDAYTKEQWLISDGPRLRQIIERGLDPPKEPS